MRRAVFFKMRPEMPERESVVGQVEPRADNRRGKKLLAVIEMVPRLRPRRWVAAPTFLKCAANELRDGIERRQVEFREQFVHALVNGADARPHGGRARIDCVRRLSGIRAEHPLSAHRLRQQVLKRRVHRSK